MLCGIIIGLKDPKTNWLVSMIYLPIKDINNYPLFVSNALSHRNKVSSKFSLTGSVLKHYWPVLGLGQG